MCLNVLERASTFPTANVCLNVCMCLNAASVRESVVGGGRAIRRHEVLVERNAPSEDTFEHAIATDNCTARNRKCIMLAAHHLSWNVYIYIYIYIYVCVSCFLSPAFEYIYIYMCVSLVCFFTRFVSLHTSY